MGIVRMDEILRLLRGGDIQKVVKQSRNGLSHTAVLQNALQILGGQHLVYQGTTEDSNVYKCRGNDAIDSWKKEYTEEIWSTDSGRAPLHYGEQVRHIRPPRYPETILPRNS